MILDITMMESRKTVSLVCSLVMLARIAVIIAYSVTKPPTDISMEVAACVMLVSLMIMLMKNV